MNPAARLQRLEIQRRADLPPTHLYARLSRADRTRLMLADAYQPRARLTGILTDDRG